jgi:hypothetical protein
MLLGLSLACASTPVAGAASRRPFDFERDTLAFENELYWIYEPAPDSGEMTHRPREGVENGQRCAAMARVVRQFFYNARFAPELPGVTPAEYEELARRVLERDPRQQGATLDRVVIPAYADLRAFSSDRDEFMKQLLGGAWRSYVQRGNWRMVFPFAPGQQRSTADEIVAELERGELPIVHLVTFPKVGVNHTVLVYGARASATEKRFSVYDPNDSENPTELVFERAGATFSLAPREYFKGGVVQAYEIYDGFFF